MLHPQDKTTEKLASVVTGFLCVMSLLFCQHGCPLCHVATAEAAVWVRFWRGECHYSTRGKHLNTQHTGPMCLTLLQTAQSKKQPKCTGNGDVLTQPTVSIQMTTVHLCYSVQNHCSIYNNVQSVYKQTNIYATTDHNLIQFNPYIHQFQDSF
jgi:hypothetical protein